MEGAEIETETGAFKMQENTPVPFSGLEDLEDGGLRTNSRHSPCAISFI